MVRHLNGRKKGKKKEKEKTGNACIPTGIIENVIRHTGYRSKQTEPTGYRILNTQNNGKIISLQVLK